MSYPVKSPATKQARADEVADVSDEDFTKDKKGKVITTHGMKEMMMEMGKELRSGIGIDCKADLKSGLDRLRQDMSQELPAIRQETKAEFAKVRSENKIQSDQVASHFSPMEARLAVLESRPRDAGGGEDEAEEKQLEVIATGWADEQSEDTIVERLRTFLTVNDLGTKVLNVTCFTDPCKSGVIKFSSAGGAKQFLRDLRKAKEFNIDTDRELKFSRNRTLKQRAEDKRLGFLKHELSELPGIDLQDVKIMWKKSVVLLKGVKVFHISKKGEFVFKHEAVQVKDKVQAHVKEWTESRGGEENE